MDHKSPNKARPVADINQARRKSIKTVAAGASAVAAANIAQEKWIRPVTESILLPAHAELTQFVFNCGPDCLTSCSVYINIDPVLGVCGISENSGDNNALRIDNAGTDISLNVATPDWAVIAGGSSNEGQIESGHQSIAIHSKSTSMDFLVSFSATNDATGVAVTDTTVQNT